MKNITKKIVSSALLGSMMFSTACSSVPQSEMPTLLSFRNTDAAAVVAMIDAIPEATLETESAVEAAYAAYYELEDGAQAQVTNFERLKTLRDEIADLYEIKRTGDRIDRSKILIGTGGLSFYSEERIKEIDECEIDFVIYDGGHEPLDLLSKYGIGVINRVYQFDIPYYRGNNRKRGEEPNPDPSYDESKLREALPDISTFDHEAIWGIDIIDEPTSADFSYHEMQRSVMQEKYPNLFMFINLHPNNGGGPEYLGVEKYQDYIDAYVEDVNSDYISYDNYMYRGEGVQLGNFLENARIVANACRENDREFWIWIQANFPVDDGRTVSVDQMRMQANTILTFGATSIIWACWHPWWWYQNIFDSEGNKTEQYDKVKTVNQEINILSPSLIKYKNIDTNILGYKTPEAEKFYLNDDNIIAQDTFVDVHMPQQTKDSVL